jgi:HEAT repeat protein
MGLHRLLTADRTHHIRRSAATAFGSVVTDPGHRSAASRLLSDRRDRAKDSHTRNLAAIALGRIGGDVAYRSLCKGVRESASHIHRAYSGFGLAILMRRVQDTATDPKAYDLRRGVRCLRNAFDREKNLSTRSALALALGIARDRDTAPRLLRALRSTKDQTFRGYVSLALGMLEHQAAVPDLTHLVLHTKYAPHIKEQIALGLGIIGVKNLLPLIASLKQSRAAYDLDAIVRAVGLVGDHTAVEPLTALATDRRAQNRTRAATCQALGILGDPRPIPALAAIRADHNYLASSGTLNDILMRTF